jgi:putative tryptophan/tyrosine transport system substrate-binding protein
MRRREFITVLGGAAAWPFAARAQETMPVIGYLSARSPDDTAHLVDAFRRGLAENGYVEGRNVTIEYRWAIGQHNRLRQLAEEFVNKRVAVVVSTGGESAALAAKAATSTIPIVFSVGRDPVKLGLVASYNRPGGNASGINILTQALEPKRLGLLQQLLPQATTFGVLLDPNYSAFENQLHDVEEAGRVLGLPVHSEPVPIPRSTRHSKQFCTSASLRWWSPLDRSLTPAGTSS